MASTYSSSLRLELMATGDQSGTWGDTTNTNLGTLLEQAITGVLSVAQGDVANLTLTSLNGASDQARNAVVNLTGAMTAARNVVVPTANKLYLVKNSTTGGFAVTVKTSGGTGVAVPPGTARWVYCDGTNVVDGLPGVVAGYTTTATAAGTTTLTVGSTAQQFFTGSTTQTVSMPVVTTLPVLGTAWRIVNNSTGAVTVNSSGGNAIIVLPANTESWVTCILLTGTTAASWFASAPVSVSGAQTLTNKTLASPTFSGTATGPLALTGTLSVSTTAAGTIATLTSTDSGASAGPGFVLDRASSSPAINDIIGNIVFRGRDSGGNNTAFGYIEAVISNPTDGAEGGSVDHYAVNNGVVTKIFSVGPNLDVAIGQVRFPATQNPSSNANTLDDYEEGTFTPSLVATGTTLSYNAQQGRYTKIGRVVNYSIFFQLNTSGNTLSANGISIAGLPFAASSSPFIQMAGQVRWGSSTTSYVNVQAGVDVSASTMTITAMTAAATSSSVTPNASALLHATNGSILFIQGWYEAAN